MSRKKLKLYLDTSVFGQAINWRNRSRKNEANRLLGEIRAGRFIGAYSSVTAAEVMAAPPGIARKLVRKIKWARLRRVRLWNRGLAEQLAERYCDAQAIPEEFFDDARHVAIASLWGADALVSYNFAHLVRLRTIVLVNRINRDEGIRELVICQPREVIEP